MTRPLIEFIYAQYLSWQDGIIGGARKNVAAKILSRETAPGEMSAIVRYPAGWSRSVPEALTAEEEMYVLDGEIAINGRTYTRDTYACFPAGYVRERAEAPQGCVALTFYDGVPESTIASMRTDTPLVEYINLYDTPWDTTVADPSIAWMGNRRKVLRWDPVHNQKATFVLATPPHIHPEDWRCPTLTHPCAEESFVLAGDFTGPQGRQGPGAYFWRPAHIAHGPFGTRDGGMALLRFRHGPHVNVWGDAALRFTYDSPYAPMLPPELVPLAKEYAGGARY